MPLHIRERAMPITYRDYLPMAVKNEGHIAWMYLDTRCNVTVGIGHLLSTSSDAEALAFIERDTDRPATGESIGAAFDTVRDAHGLAPRGASGFEPITTIRLPRAAVIAVFETDFDRIVRRIRSLFAQVGGGLDSFPQPAQLAVVDMAFNLGPIGLYTKFPRFRESGLGARDFAVAADECHRKDVSASRNAETRSLLLKAARVETRNPGPSAAVARQRAGWIED